MQGLILYQKVYRSLHPTNTHRTMVTSFLIKYIFLPILHNHTQYYMLESTDLY